MPYTGNPNYANPNFVNPQITNQGMVNPHLGTAAGSAGALGLSDRDLFDLMLAQHKHMAESMTQTILETANPQLRQDCINILNRDFMHQRMIWEAMHQRGWYSINAGFTQNIGQPAQPYQQFQQQNQRQQQTTTNPQMS